MQECSALGIDCSNIRGGLLGLTAELPALAAAAVEALQAEGVSQGMQYYASVAGSQQQEQGEAALLPVLAEVREGRTEAPAAAAARRYRRRGSAGTWMLLTWQPLQKTAAMMRQAQGAAPQAASAGR